jgi:hypothetical protein
VVVWSLPPQQVVAAAVAAGAAREIIFSSVSRSSRSRSGRRVIKRNEKLHIEMEALRFIGSAFLSRVHVAQQVLVGAAPSAPHIRKGCANDSPAQCHFCLFWPTAAAAAAEAATTTRATTAPSSLGDELVDQAQVCVRVVVVFVVVVVVAAAAVAVAVRFQGASPCRPLSLFGSPRRRWLAVRAPFRKLSSLSLSPDDTFR